MNKLKKMMQLAKANKKGGSGQSTNLTSEATDIINENNSSEIVDPSKNDMSGNLSQSQSNESTEVKGNPNVSTQQNQNTKADDDTTVQAQNSKLYTYKIQYSFQVGQKTESIEVTAQADSEEEAFELAKIFLIEEAKKRYPEQEVSIEYRNQFSILNNQELQNESK